MIGFIIGAMVGGCIGVAVMCLCRIAADADRNMEEKENDG